MGDRQIWFFVVWCWFRRNNPCFKRFRDFNQSQLCSAGSASKGEETNFWSRFPQASNAGFRALEQQAQTFDDFKIPLRNLNRPKVWERKDFCEIGPRVIKKNDRLSNPAIVLLFGKDCYRV
jgi:hypothetical protein